jgi:hypothetical protein
MQWEYRMTEIRYYGTTYPRYSVYIRFMMYHTSTLEYPELVATVTIFLCARMVPLVA